MEDRLVEYLVFTDLDGTLLDEDTYRFDAAGPALKLLKDRNIPVILCSSKTRLELEHYRSLLKNHHPFVAENGGAVFIPKRYFGFSASHTIRDEYEVLEFGLSYAILIRALEQCRRETGVRVTGFHELSTEEVARLTGLPLQEAQWARIREYDEPFLLHEENDRPVIEEWVRREGMRIIRGRRFSHLTGSNDKGKAVRMLLNLFRRDGDWRVVSLGDSPNDLPMLEEADVPMLVQHPDGTHDPRVQGPKIVRVDGIGPAGWNRAILELLADGRGEIARAQQRQGE
ncbi:MAG: HAD-IIB family hydrolase [Candidatus Methylomirabilales bacterium]